LAYFSALQQRASRVHIHHASHHVLTIKNHVPTTRFFKTTLKNPSKNSKAPGRPGASTFLPQEG
jgi:hypothetical protein